MSWFSKQIEILITYEYNLYCIFLFFFTGYDMSTFIRRYSRYLNEKAVSYRQVAFDFTKVKRG